MKRIAIGLLFLLASCAGQFPPVNVTVPANTRAVVWLFYGLGDAITSPGIPEIGQKLSAIPGVYVAGYFSSSLPDQSSQVAALVTNAPANVIKIIVGYSCGVGATGEVADDVSVPVYVVGIQGSLYCPPPPLNANVIAAQETLNEDCSETLGLGCAQYTAGPGFPAGRITLINRPDSHGEADIDVDAQSDVVRFVQSTLNASAKLRRPANDNHIHIIVRHKGQ